MHLVPLVGVALLDLCSCLCLSFGFDSQLFELELVLFFLSLLFIELLFRLHASFFVSFVGLNLKHFIMLGHDAFVFLFELFEEFPLLRRLGLHGFGFLNELPDVMFDFFLEKLQIFLHFFFTVFVVLLLLFIFIRMGLLPQFLVVVFGSLELLSGIFFDFGVEFLDL